MLKNTKKWAELEKNKTIKDDLDILDREEAFSGEVIAEAESKEGLDGYVNPQRGPIPVSSSQV